MLTDKVVNRSNIPIVFIILTMAFIGAAIGFTVGNVDLLYVGAVSYTHLEGDTLLDSGEITDLQENDGKIAFDYQASAIMEKGKEYFLTFNMSTDKHKNLHYYTRVMQIGADVVEDQIAFAKDFSDRTFNENEAKGLVAYIEPDAKGANDNLGVTTIKSSYSMLAVSYTHLGGRA